MDNFFSFMLNKKENIRNIYTRMRHNFMMLLIGSFYSPKIKTNKFIVLPREVNFMSLGMLTPTGEKRTNIKIMATYKKERNFLLNFFF